MSLGVEPHHWRWGHVIGVGPPHWGWGHVTKCVGHITGGGASCWGRAMSLQVKPRHWWFGHVTGMEPCHWGGHVSKCGAPSLGVEPHHWGRSLISGDAGRGEARSCHSAVCVGDHLSAASSLHHLSANLSFFMGSHFSACRPLGVVQQQHPLSHVQTCAHMRIQASPAAAFQPQTWGHANPLTYPYEGPENWRQKV